jgi:hypothetical protein
MSRNGTSGGHGGGEKPPKESGGGSGGISKAEKILSTASNHGGLIKTFFAYCMSAIFESGFLPVMIIIAGACFFLAYKTEGQFSATLLSTGTLFAGIIGTYLKSKK